MRSISMHLMWPFGRVARRFGVPDDSAVALELHRYESAAPEVRVPWDAAVESIEAIIRITGCRDLGLLAARATQPLDLAPIARAVLPQRTLADGLAAHDRFYPLLTDGMVWESARTDGRELRTLRGADGMPVPVALQEFSFSVWATLLRFMSGRKDIGPAEVRFTHPEPVDTTPHERAFRCPLVFDAPEAALILDDAVRTLPCIFHDAVEACAFERTLQRQLEALPEATIAELVMEQLGRGLSDGVPTPAQVARRLGLSPRQLQRRLRQEGTSFRKLLDRIRVRWAQHYLTGSQLGSVEIAERLGFSSVHAFQRAHRRMTGRTPASIRNSARTLLARG